ncbi:MAG: DUF5320 domain-containing protein [Clostridiales bacterium]|nr:DUF5320 domain-containing protein [Clostridiales bacterium]
MPRGDGTGPDGYGPKTGRGAGYCAGFSKPDCRPKPRGGCCRYHGRGYGRGLEKQRSLHKARHYEFFDYSRRVDSQNEADEIRRLQRRVESLEKQLTQVSEQLSGLKQNE